jgi:hypothetical protein
MRRTPVVAVLATTLFLGGCTGTGVDAGPTGGAASGPEPTTAPADPVPSGPALDFGGGTGGTTPSCGDPKVYLAVRQTVEVLREVELGDPTVVGAGELVGRVYLAPAAPRERNTGLTVLGDRPGLGAVSDEYGWDERRPLAGEQVEPGRYAVFLQVAARPGRPVEGVAFPWSDRATTGSDTLDVAVSYAPRCD